MHHLHVYTTVIASNARYAKFIPVENMKIEIII